MANAFTNFLNGFVGGLVGDTYGNLRDYQHASRLYLTNYYEFVGKAGWLYYVVLNINPQLQTAINPAKAAEFFSWYSRYGGRVGLLAKQVDAPKFKVETETLNQYNRKVVVQKQIKYTDIAIVFHDDMANATTDLWKNYYQYYYADGVTSSSGFSFFPQQINPKYIDTKYQAENLDAGALNYGLNNNQTVPFFSSIDIFQLNRHKFTSFKLINPIITSWDHDQLDQTQGNRLLTSKMNVAYESVIYNTSPMNRTSINNPGFAIDHYDNTPSPLGVGSKSLFGENGVIAGAFDVLGDLQNIDQASPLDLLGTALKGYSVVKNAKALTKEGIKQEGYSILNSVLSNVSSTPVAVQNIDGTVSRVPASDRITAGIGQTISNVSQQINPAGINLFTGFNSSVNNFTYAKEGKI